MNITTAPAWLSIQEQVIVRRWYDKLLETLKMKDPEYEFQFVESVDYKCPGCGKVHGKDQFTVKISGDQSHRNRRVRIVKMGLAETLSVLTHETIHIWQYVTGRMEDKTGLLGKRYRTFEGRRFGFEEQSMIASMVSDLGLPWEEEAYGMTMELFAKVLATMPMSDTRKILISLEKALQKPDNILVNNMFTAFMIDLANKRKMPVGEFILEVKQSD